MKPNIPSTVAQHVTGVAIRRCAVEERAYRGSGSVACGDQTDRAAFWGLSWERKSSPGQSIRAVCSPRGNDSLMGASFPGTRARCSPPDACVYREIYRFSREIAGDTGEETVYGELKSRGRAFSLYGVLRIFVFGACRE